VTPTLHLHGGPADGEELPYIGPFAPAGYSRPTLRRDHRGEPVSGQWIARWCGTGRHPHCGAQGCPGGAS
jgi:hypothetical protein